MNRASAAINLTKCLSIHAASKLCGLSPSVLRIWELRYGWPNPQRRPNGYRAYSRHLIEDLKKVAKMVQEGKPISEIIFDGMPQFAPEPETVDAHRRAIDSTRQLPRPESRTAQRMQDTVFAALEQRSGGQLMELMQRSSWELKPSDENLVVLAPAVMGILEQLPRDKELQPSELAVFDQVLLRARQLMSRFPVEGNYLVLAASKPDHPALAAVAALALRQRGINATAWTGEGEPSTSFVPVRMVHSTKRRAFEVQVGEELSLGQLFQAETVLPWRQDKIDAA
jgi:DNA-binding transcriptional MerR regulator